MKKITLLFALMVFGLLQSQNLALSGTASASSELNPASNAIDGNTGTRWESVHGDVADITIDLGTSYDIGQILLNWEGAFADDYEILISDDATFATSTVIYSTTTGDGGIDEINVTGTGRYVRMNGKHRFLNAYGYSLYEFEIYEAAEPSTDATLSNLTYNGTPVTDFSKNTLNYNVVLPQGSSAVPTVVATASQAAPASAVITDAGALPGTTTVLVTAQDGTTTNTYTIYFSVQVTPMSYTFDMTFEPSTPGSVSTRWDVFENGDNPPPFEVAANPDASGINTSGYVGKFTSIAGESEWAGCATQHGSIWKWKMDASSTTLTIDVYKSVISDVMVKIVNSTNGTIYAVAQPNTKTDEWETLTYDISGLASHGENNDNVDTIVIHTDIQKPRATDNVTYIDNISWSALITGNAPVLSTKNIELSTFKAYPNPTKNVWNIVSNSQNLDFVKVYDLSGKEVISLKPNSKEAVIDASSLNAGLYFARLESSSGTKIIKLIKK
jgi:hypothetical protein